MAHAFRGLEFISKPCFWACGEGGVCGGLAAHLMVAGKQSEEKTGSSIAPIKGPQAFHQLCFLKVPPTPIGSKLSPSLILLRISRTLTQTVNTCAAGTRGMCCLPHAPQGIVQQKEEVFFMCQKSQSRKRSRAALTSCLL